VLDTGWSEAAKALEYGCPPGPGDGRAAALRTLIRAPVQTPTMRRPGRAVVLATLLATAVLAAGCAGVVDLDQSSASAEDGVEVTVVRVVDGDTVEFEYDNGTRDTARLVGIDSPEVHVANEPEDFEGVPDTDAGAACLRDWGHRASEYVRSRVLGETVRLELDEREGPRDRYDRLLAYVHADGDLLNRDLIDQGYAVVYDTQFSRRESFDEAEAAAREADAGLWECREPSARTATPSDAPLAVVEVHADATGDDRENLDDEYVVFENVGDDRLDLSGWRVTDEAGHAYEFPDGFALDPGERVTLHTGSGEDTDTELYWGAGRPVWNNDGDTVTVSDEEGTLVVERG